jgi:hypothetical protein
VPLLGGLDFEAFDRHVTARHLVTPDAFARPVQRQRGRWKIGIQRIRTNSAVPWRRWVEAALVTPDEVGLDSLTLIAESAEKQGDSAQPPASLLALLGVLNSSLLNRWYKLTFTDVNVKPLYVARVPVPPLTDALTALVRERLARPGDLALERRIDRAVATAYGLSDDAVDVLENGFWEGERSARPLPQRSF